jgi:hypothetical protein
MRCADHKACLVQCLLRTILILSCHFNSIMRNGSPFKVIDMYLRNTSIAV